ncbi:MAG: DUF1800 family protein [Saprospiraceae bacterium]|nr:DUF1800 family protein [Saprospiraceae bacterium]
MPVPKYTGAFGQAELLHLLRRSLFGVNNSDLKLYKGKSLDQVVDSLLNFSTTASEPLKAYTIKENNVQVDKLDKDVPFGTSWVNTPIINQDPNPDGNRRESLKAWRTGLMLNQESNLREILTLFWHNHFSTETDEITSLFTYRTNKRHRDNCLASFKKILTDITLDFTMLRYLNGYVNSKAAPDENYAREIQELFAIGKGPDSGYTEDDIKEAAKIFTGWSYTTNKYDTTPATPSLPRLLPNNDPATPKEFTSRSGNHYYQDPKDPKKSYEKKFSAFYNDKVIKHPDTVDSKGNLLTPTYDTMKAELDQFIDMLLATDECARHLVRRFYIFFIHYNITPEIEQNFIKPLAADYKKDNYDTKKMLKAFFTSAEFYNSCNRGAMVKSPATFIVSLLRQFGMKLPTSDTIEAQYAFRSTIKNYGINMGQDFMDAPDVAGWPAYYQVPSFHEMWLNTATYPQRKTFYENMLKNGITSGSLYFEAKSQGLKFTIDFVEFTKGFSKPDDPNVLIDESCALLFGAPVSQSVKDQLKKNYLLQQQSTDYYWTNAYNEYVANPSTTDPTAKKVPTILKDLYLDMCGAAEYNLC